MDPQFSLSSRPQPRGRRRSPHPGLGHPSQASTRIAIETLSIESRLTAERSGTGSSPGSRRTSLGSPRMVVVQGAMSARRWRGMTASRDRTTTGLRPISAISHHHTSPRAGKSVMTPRPPVGTRPSLPIRLARRAGARRTRRSWRPLRPLGGEPTGQQGLRQQVRSQASRTPCGRSRGGRRQPWCSSVCDSCHNHATICLGGSSPGSRAASGLRPSPLFSFAICRCRLPELTPSASPRQEVRSLAVDRA